MQKFWEDLQNLVLIPDCMVLYRLRIKKWISGVYLVLTFSRGVAVELIDNDRVSNILHLDILEANRSYITRSTLKQMAGII